MKRNYSLVTIAFCTSLFHLLVFAICSRYVPHYKINALLVLALIPTDPQHTGCSVLSNSPVVVRRNLRYIGRFLMSISSLFIPPETVACTCAAMIRTPGSDGYYSARRRSFSHVDDNAFRKGKYCSDRHNPCFRISNKKQCLSFQ
jgi:hypothetical protein